ncbi:uncharacterized protein [Aegilops tauschii subsp. strangulata]|uniref:uncharacterized protein isoform X2 n=1 Tax=Aegilops tauschii subsp. strangulata TaxID=200361 RepID=UPI001ABBF8A6|nr:microtubule cross-linking factor 1 isoform X2 [Aegilops tauschii subsp. strangulata]
MTSPLRQKRVCLRSPCRTRQSLSRAAPQQQPHQERPETAPGMPSASTTPPRESPPARERSPARESSSARGSSPPRDSTSVPPATETTTTEPSTDPSAPEPMETEVAANDAADPEGANGADDPAGDEAAKAAAAAAGGGSGDRTDDPEAAGAPGAAPTTDPSATAAAPGSEEPQPGVYLKAGDGIFINLPWASSSRAPVEGEGFDGEVLASAGLTVVDAPSSSSGEPEEERLLRKLLSLYRARQAKLESREALVAKAGVDLEKHAEELGGFHQEALWSLAKEREQLAEAQQAFFLEKAEVEEQQRLAAEKLAVQEGELSQRQVNLDSHEEELAACEQTVGGALKEAKDAAAAAEAAKKVLEMKVAQLEAGCKAYGEELSAAKDSNADLESKLTALTKTLDGAKEREAALKKEIEADKALLESAATTQNAFRETVEHWTESLVNVAADIDKELTQLGMEDLGYPSDEDLQPSTKITLFFKGVATALQRLRERIPKQLADESRKICAGALQKVLMKVAFRNPGLRLTNVLRSLPPDVDLEELKALVAPIVDRVSGIKRVEGDRVD